MTEGRRTLTQADMDVNWQHHQPVVLVWNASEASSVCSAQTARDSTLNTISIFLFSLVRTSKVNRWRAEVYSKWLSLMSLFCVNTIWVSEGDTFFMLSSDFFFSSSQIKLLLLCQNARSDWTVSVKHRDATGSHFVETFKCVSWFLWFLSSCFWCAGGAHWSQHLWLHPPVWPWGDQRKP